MRRSIILLGVLCGICTCTFAQSGGRQMTLRQMFASADSLNATLRAADFGVEQSRAGVEVARNSYLPSIQAGASVSWIGLGYSMDRDFSNVTDEQLPGFGANISLQASQVVFAGGAIKNGVKAAQIGSQLSEIKARSNRNEVRYLIAGTALEIVKLSNQMKTLDANIELTRKVLQQMQTRYEEGTVLRSDISRYELQEKNLEFSKQRLESAIDIMYARLAMAVGLPEGERITPVIDTQAPSIGEDFDASGSPAVLAASLATELSQTKLAIAKAERLPSIAIFASDTFNGPDVTTFISGKMAGYGRLDKNFNFATVGIGITYNIDNLYKSGKKIRESRAALSKSRAELDEARAGIDLALTASLTQYRNSFTQIDICEQALSLAQTTYTQVYDRYNSGLATITDLLDAASAKLESEIGAINARMDNLASYYELQYICATL